MENPVPDDSERPWPVVDFLLRLREDEARNRVRPLRDYLLEFPEHEDVPASTTTQVKEGLVSWGIDQTNDCLNVRPCLCSIAMRIELEILASKALFVPRHHAMPCSFL